jgi:hypothetical protein
MLTALAPSPNAQLGSRRAGAAESRPLLVFERRHSRVFGVIVVPSEGLSLREKRAFAALMFSRFAHTRDQSCPSLVL